MARIDALAAFTDEPGKLTRLYLSPSHVAAAKQVKAWMQDAGMQARIDTVGNVVGRYEGTKPGPALLLGSHIDSVRDAGKYDGPLGVLAAIAVVDILHRNGERPTMPIEVIAFGDEEGVRFPTTLIGSHAVAGTLDPAVFDAKDSDGISVRAALAAIGGDADRFAECARRKNDVGAYLELHIEQGPVLEAEGLPLAAVTAINGASRFLIEVTGQAGHAGTVPMRLRSDALAASAEMILAIEREANAVPDLVATVGRIEAQPGAANVISGRTTFTLDIRASDDAVRGASTARLQDILKSIADRRGCGIAIKKFHDTRAVACDAGLIALLESAIEEVGSRPRRLTSGAGHDAMAMADLCPSAMLFVRCKGGISHNPAESITVEDADIAVRALLSAVRAFGRQAARPR